MVSDWQRAEMVKTKRRLPGGSDVRAIVRDGRHEVAFANGSKFGTVNGVTVEFSDNAVAWYHKRLLPLDSALFGIKKGQH